MADLRDGRRLRVIGRTEILPPAIRARAQADLPFAIDFELIDGIEGLRRVVSRPDSFDVYHQWHKIDLVWTARSIQSIELARIAGGEDIRAAALARTGDARVIGTVFDRLFLQRNGKLGPEPSDRLSMLPSLHGVDAFAYLDSLRADLAPGEPDSWAFLLDPRWRGRVAILSDPVLGMIEAALATEAAHGIAFGDIGNLTVEEIDLIADTLIRAKRLGHFRGVWLNYQEAAGLMQRGGVVLQSMFSPGLMELRRAGVPAVMSVPVEGFRGWHADLCISAATGGEMLDAAYAYLNWWHAGWPGACLSRQGYYATFPHRARPHLSAAEWAYWYEGEPAATELVDPAGRIVVPAGHRREGGSHRDRMSRARVWNTFMDDHTYLVRRWKEFLEA